MFVKTEQYFPPSFFIGTLLGVILFALFSCQQRGHRNAVSCLSCHQDYKEVGVHLDRYHQFSCTVCHQGNEKSYQQKEAHQGLIAHPSHPKNWQGCAQCHQQEITDLVTTTHYTLAPLINRFRKEFGARDDVAGAKDIHSFTDPQSILDLADDLLRRRCLRCHIFDNGDGYGNTRHGTGCASCHSSYVKGLISNNFSRPEDDNCLSCHYGNYVGADYYGHFEADYSAEYHLLAEKIRQRPYGINYIELVPDIHQQKGLQCIDCHSGHELMSGGEKPSCSSCHNKQELARKKSAKTLPAGVHAVENGGWQFFDAAGILHPLPIMEHKAHLYKNIACQACHAQWSFNDTGKHFFRSDTDNFDIFAELAVQGNHEVEEFITHNTDFNNTEYEPAMRDTISGKTSRGIWYKSLGMRRWEVQVGYDNVGNLVVVRPLLDYQLSWVDDEDEVRFDSVLSKSLKKSLQSHSNTIRYYNQPYTPHTTGKAGMFYMERILQKPLKREAALKSKKREDR